MNQKIIKIFFFWVLCFFYLSLQGQEKNKYLFNPTKVGVLYTSANEKNFLFDDLDYAYSTNTLKLQAFYTLGTWKSIHFEWIVQPQMQFLKHQLFNEQFVLPSENNYIDKRAEFTQPKTLHLYALELGFSVKKNLTKKMSLQAIIGLGVATIDKRTERLARGFTFIENATIGILYKTSANTLLHLGCVAGHVSNFDTKNPNGGYNTLGLEVGFQFQLP